MVKALFVGDVNPDLIMGGLKQLPMIDREITCQTMRLTIGSSAAIAACAFASLGAKAALCGLAGEDMYGNMMLEGLADFGVDTSLVKRTNAAETGLTVCLIMDGQRAQVTYPGTIALFDGGCLTEETLRSFDHVHFTGVYQQTAFLPRVTAALKLLRGLGISTSLDPQWDETERWEYMDEWLMMLDYLFVNEAEARAITGATGLEAACCELGERTACPIVKAGPRGALLWRDNLAQLIPPFRATVVDTTGAGDSFAAGALFALKELDYSIYDAVRFGNAVGARCCGFLGGVTARSSYEDIIRYMKDNA